jgi:hypothetical protein
LPGIQPKNGFSGRLILEKLLFFINRINPAKTTKIFAARAEDCLPQHVPGSLKNALDWTVVSGEFINKPVALITASSQSEKGHAALLLILTAISARIVEKSSFVISFIRAKLDEKGAFKDPQTRPSPSACH